MYNKKYLSDKKAIKTTNEFNINVLAHISRE